MASYQEAPWAREPPSDCSWSLLEVKSGVQIAKHPLTRPTTLLGRAVDQVHIAIHHESASRQHARIAFDGHGMPWLKDLKSTHGSYVNKKQLPAKACSKQESNSTQSGARGVRLFPGDMLQFGASTRMYCLDGPEEYERGSRALLPKTNPATTTPASAQVSTTTAGGSSISSIDSTSTSNSNTNNNDLVSWGIDMSESEESSSLNSSEHKTISMDAQVPEKHRKSLEKLNGWKYKLANLQTEDDRIRRKGELTEGQEKQLQRNSEREAALQEQIQELETDLYYKLHPNEASAASSAASNKRRRKYAAASLNEEEDDMEFFDRTKEQQQLDNNNSGEMEEAESEESLIRKWKSFHQRSVQRKARLGQARSNLDDVAQRLQRLESSGDEEAFFVKNDLQLAQEAVDVLEKEGLKDRKVMIDTERLLKYVNPKIVTDQTTGYIGEGRPPSPSRDAHVAKKVIDVPSTTMMLPPPKVIPKPPVPSFSTPSSDGNTFSMPPPPPNTTELSQPRLPPGPSSTISSMDRIMPPPSKRSRVMGPSAAVLPPPAFDEPVPPKSLPPPAHEHPGTASSKKSIKGPLPPPGGTLSMLNAMTKINASSDSGDKAKATTTKNVSVAINPQKDEWRAPKDQDGSGITKLNAKFAGRY